MPPITSAVSSIVATVPEGRQTSYEITDPRLTRALGSLVDVVLTLDGCEGCTDENCDVPFCCGDGA